MRHGDDARDLDVAILSRMRRTSRDYPADSEKLIHLADALQISPAEFGRRLRRLERRGRGIVSVRPGVYAFDATAIREPRVTRGNRRAKRRIALAVVPAAQRESMARKALVLLRKMESDNARAGKPTLKRLDAAIRTQPPTAAEIARRHDRESVAYVQRTVAELVAAGHAEWVAFGCQVGVAFNRQGAARWLAALSALHSTGMAIAAGFGRLPIASVDNFAAITLGSIATDRELEAAGLGTTKQIGDRRTHLRTERGFDLKDRGALPVELPPDQVEAATLKIAGLVIVTVDGERKAFLPVTLRV